MASIGSPTSDDPAPSDRGSGTLLRSVVENLAAPTFLVKSDGELAYVNPAFADLLGYEPKECAGLKIDAIVHHDDAASVRAQIASLAREEAAACRAETRYLRKNGEPIWVLASTSLVRGPGFGPQSVIVQALDIDGRKRAEAKLMAADGENAAGADDDEADLKSAEEKLQFANTLLTTQMETSPDGILVVDANARIISFNRRFADMWGVSLDLLEAKDDAPVLAAVTSAMKDPQAFVARVKYLYQHPEEGGRDELETRDGRFIDRHTGVLRTPAGAQLGRVWFFRDITERKLAEAEILRMARRDALTGLANRPVFMEAVQSAIASVRRGAKPFGVLYLDLDRFKDVNDTLGHPVGDAFLREVAERLKANTRSTDIVARFGGDEFAVMVTDVNEPADAAIVADTIVRAMSAPFVIDGNDIRSGASIGISLFGPDEPDKDTILARADVALYRAKSEKTGEYRFHTEAMDHEIRSRVALGAELREGIARGQLFLQYQPQADIATGRITGVEAMVRWRHPARGVLTPDLFIPVAEKSGLIATLGHWVLREACGQARAWLAAGDAPDVIAINLSAVQFKRAFELEREIALVLKETGLPPSRLELELTEAALMAASREHNSVLQRLRESGVRFAIDDFGTGYSSLDYLRRLPASRIKIARVFVEQIAKEPGCAAVVKAAIGLARELDIGVVAEGVETPAQLDLLKSWECPEAQGNYFTPPLSADEVPPLFARAGIFRGRKMSSRTAA